MTQTVCNRLCGPHYLAIFRKFADPVLEDSELYSKEYLAATADDHGSSISFSLRPLSVLRGEKNHSCLPKPSKICVILLKKKKKQMLQ